jgi:pimeloyl-ACP methyl ester carboxylesterase
MRTELVTIQTPTIPIDGAYHTPDSGTPHGAVLLFHGNTMNFYTGMSRFLPPVLTKLGFACLAFNRRGHDVITTRNSRAAEGGAFQTTAEALEDNRLAAQWLAAKGFPAPVVIGHSNGGMLGTQHVVDHPQTPALVLLSAGRGGRTSMQASGDRDRVGPGEQFPEILAQAQAAVKAGRPQELLFMPGWWWVIGAESFLDRAETVPSTVELAAKIKCPVFCIRGGLEPRDRYPAEEYAAAAAGPCKVEIVPDCDHFYNGHEDVVAAHVAAWLTATFKLPSPA